MPPADGSGGPAPATTRGRVSKDGQTLSLVIGAAANDPAIERDETCRALSFGAAGFCARRRWSSGRAGQVVCTTAFVTSGPTIIGRLLVWRRNGASLIAPRDRCGGSNHHRKDGEESPRALLLEKIRNCRLPPFHI